MSLQLVHAREAACWPWGLRHLEPHQPTLQALCRPCGRAVALPASRRQDRPVCIYCGLDSGLVTPVDAPIDGAA